MKRMKKALALLLTLAVVVAMAVVPAMAASLSVAADSDRTYNVYQVFTGTVGENDTLTGLVWGQNGTGTPGDTVPTETLTALEGTSEADLATAITQYVNTTTPIDTVSAGASITVDPGYYYLTSESDTQVVVVTGDETITPKSDLPTMVKKVQDTNDSTGVTSDWQDSADYDIGDQVPFRLSATVTDGMFAQIGTENNVWYTFHDDLSDGLTFNPDSVRVTVGGESRDWAYTIQTPDSPTFGTILNGRPVHTEGFDCDVEITVLVDTGDIGREVAVEYTAQLNDQAVLGATGNPNEAYLVYWADNCVDWGVTEEDTVIVFTYQAIINKVDGENEPLAGAAFTLEKLIGETWTEVGTTQAGEATTFTFSGLDDGNYRLTETTTPDGYNTIDPIEFTITAEHSVEAAEPALTSLTVTPDTAGFTGSTTDGSVTTSIVNQSGSTLPETGGMGTTIFYIVGALLVIGAGVVIITRKRMHNNER